jgi:hypothetical protein
MVDVLRARLYLEDPPFHNPMEYTAIHELTAEELAERAARETQYRFLGYVKCNGEVDLHGEWAEFCALRGLRYNHKNNFPNKRSTGKCLTQWLSDAGVEWFEPTGPKQAAQLSNLPGVYLDYID